MTYVEELPSKGNLWLESTIKLSEEIVLELKGVQHSQDLARRLMYKMESSIKVLVNLREDYDTAKENRTSYDLAFKNYYDTVKLCLIFVKTFQGRSILTRFLFQDEFKAKFFECFREIDMAVSLLQLNLAVQIKLNERVSNTYITVTSQNLQQLRSKVDLMDRRMSKVDGLRSTQPATQSLAKVGIERFAIDLDQGIELPYDDQVCPFFVLHKWLYQDTVLLQKRPKKGKLHLCKELIQSELATLTKLKLCSNVVKYWGYNQGDRLTPLTEYCAKGSLHHYLDHYKLGITSKVRFTLDIVTALAYLHQLNLTHCFLSTFTIYVTQDLQCKVGDLELKYCSQAEQPIQFTSPELLQGNSATQLDDLYALAMVLWSIWSNRFPYTWLEFDAIKSHVRAGDRELLCKIKPNVLVVKHTVERLWDRNLEDRPSAEQVLQKLEVLVPMGLLQEARHQDRFIPPPELEENSNDSSHDSIQIEPSFVLDQSWLARGIDFEDSFSNQLDLRPDNLPPPVVPKDRHRSSEDLQKLHAKQLHRQVRVHFNPPKAQAFRSVQKKVSHDQLSERSDAKFPPPFAIVPTNPPSGQPFEAPSVNFFPVKVPRDAVPTFLLKKP